MQVFKIAYLQTKVTKQEVEIVANSLEEAIEKVRFYEFDNSHSEETDCIDIEYSGISGELAEDD